MSLWIGSNWFRNSGASSPPPPAQGSLQLCRWLAGISSLLLSFPVHGATFFSHFTLPFFFSPPRSKLPNVGGQGVVAGLSKDAGATDSFPQVNGLLLSPWQCSLLVMVGTRMVFAQKYQLFNESSGSRFKGESREYAPEPPRQGSQKCTSLLNSPVSGHLLFKVASFFSHKDGHSLPEPSTARGHLSCFSDVTVLPEQIICRKALLSRNSSVKTGWSFAILEPSTSLRGQDLQWLPSLFFLPGSWTVGLVKLSWSQAGLELKCRQGRPWAQASPSIVYLWNAGITGAS